MQNKNIVLFSSGVSEKNGVLRALDTALEQRGYVCEYWRDLFANANDAKNIALLPMLIKKIPTFDYAVLICEGHDTTVMRRQGRSETVHTMRDNVLFEIGLCVMALGLSRTILVTDGDVHLPEDLTGVRQETAVKRIVYRGGDTRSWRQAGESLTAYLDSMESVSDEIGRYIRETGMILSPVVIGAASSTA
ncbi:MAG: nucleotide-binding protein, partial [Clostridia bacterium]|nr:nucleotide-binding protein [Clostridia bacterium]